MEFELLNLLAEGKRRKDLEYSEVKKKTGRGKNAIEYVDKVLVRLAGHESGSWTRLSKAYKKLDQDLKDLQVLRDDMNAEIKKEALELFNDEDAVYSRVVETSQLFIKLSKETLQPEKKKLEKPDELVAKIQALKMPEKLSAMIAELVEAHTKIEAEYTAALKLTVDVKVTEGLGDKFKSFKKTLNHVIGVVTTRIKKMIGTYDDSLDQAKEWITGAGADYHLDIKESVEDFDDEISDELLNAVDDICGEELSEAKITNADAFKLYGYTKEADYLTKLFKRKGVRAVMNTLVRKLNLQGKKRRIREAEEKSDSDIFELTTHSLGGGAQIPHKYWPDGVKYRGTDVYKLVYGDPPAVLKNAERDLKDHDANAGWWIDDVQECYLGYSKSKDQFVLGFDAWTTEMVDSFEEDEDDPEEVEESGNASPAIFFKIVDGRIKVLRTETDLGSGDTWYGTGGGHKAIHKSHPDIIDIRLD